MRGSRRHPRVDALGDVVHRVKASIRPRSNTSMRPSSLAGGCDAGLLLVEFEGDEGEP
jgi:hypothetical protein